MFARGAAAIPSPSAPSARTGRAWPLRRGARAPVAAGKIDADLQKGFIPAARIHYDDFVRVGGLGAAPSQGLLRLEGKQNEVQDGDILHVRHA